jgi:hypothetical protein
MAAQRAALTEWRQPRGERFAELKAIKQPTLVVNGDNDIMVSTINSFTLSQNILDAQLIISRCGPWRVIPGSGALRGARRDVPGRMTFHDVGLHRYTGREIEGVANHDRSP